MHAFHAEVIACLQGIQAAIGLGIGQLILETDAQKVVSAINTTNYADTATGHLVEEIKSLVDWNFMSLHLVFKGK